MQIADLGDIRLHYRLDGPPEGAPLVFANALGTDLRIWDGVIAHLPKGLRMLRYDMRGHGLSEAPVGPYAMGQLVRDAERLMDLADMRDAIFVGLSIGGMVAQGLAAKRLDLVRGLVLSHTACKIGTRQIWAERIAQIGAQGMGAIADGTLDKWFAPGFRNRLAIRHMLERTPVDGYVGCCHAISGTDFMRPTSGLRLPALGIAGAEDGSTPPDLVRETLDLIPGAQFRLMRGAGHMACVEKPFDYAQILTDFLTAQGHI